MSRGRELARVCGRTIAAIRRPVLVIIMTDDQVSITSPAAPEDIHLFVYSLRWQLSHPSATNLLLAVNTLGQLRGTGGKETDAQRTDWSAVLWWRDAHWGHSGVVSLTWPRWWGSQEGSCGQHSTRFHLLQVKNWVPCHDFLEILQTMREENL